MDYTLKDHGDLYERRFWPMLYASFPNYEIFWQRFIVPLTRRDSDGSIHLKPDIDPLLEELAMSHYSVFYHLGVSRELRRSEFFEDVFFHLSTATEMVEKLILSIAKVLGRIEDRPVATQLVEEDIHKQVQIFWEGHYKKHYNRFLETGRAVNYSFHQIDDVVRNLYSQLGEQAKKDYEAWATLKDKIRHYRNTLAHNPRLGHFIEPTTGSRVVPKENKLSNFKLWSSVHHNPALGDFIKLEDLVDEYQTALEKNTNSLWDHVINLLNQISVTDEYQKMAGGQKESSRGRPTILFTSGQVETEPPIMPSGTSTSPLLEELQNTYTGGSAVMNTSEINPNKRKENILKDKDQRD